jgi:hypothetical protein
MWSRKLEDTELKVTSRSRKLENTELEATSRLRKVGKTDSMSFRCSEFWRLGYCSQVLSVTVHSKELFEEPIRSNCLRKRSGAHCTLLAFIRCYLNTRMDILKFALVYIYTFFLCHAHCIYIYIYILVCILHMSPSSHASICH